MTTRPLETHSRTRLPARRPNLTDSFAWGGVRFTVTAGFDERGAIREVFADGVKVGSDTEGLLDDACILVSLLLQHGYTPDRLAGHLLRKADAAQSVISPHTRRRRPGIYPKRRHGAGVTLILGVFPFVTPSV